jgi:hypothetical protein
LANNPLKRNLGFFDFGRYTSAADDDNFTFVKIEEMWNKPVEAELNSKDNTSNEEEVQAATTNDVHVNDHTAEHTTIDTQTAKRQREKVPPAIQSRQQQQMKSQRPENESRNPTSTRHDKTIYNTTLEQHQRINR